LLGKTDERYVLFRQQKFIFEGVNGIVVEESKLTSNESHREDLNLSCYDLNHQHWRGGHTNKTVTKIPLSESTISS